MKRPIFTSISPNLERDDVQLTWRLLFKPWQWRRGAAIDELEKELPQFVGCQYTVTFNSGRGALYGLLQALNLEQGSEVLVQAYTCVAVPEPVLWSGLQPVYVDIDRATLTMSSEDLQKKISSNSKVLIIQHTFGQVADIEALITIARQHNLFVIEDCAHALGATYNGQPVGSFGDASFFSFGRDKVISSVFGGAAATNDLNLAKKIRIVQQQAAMPGWLWIRQQLNHPIVTYFAKRYYSFFSIGKLVMYISKNLKIISKAVYPKEKRGERVSFLTKKMPNALAVLALHQLKKLKRFNNHRRAAAQQYQNQLKGLGIDMQKEIPGSQGIFLRFFISMDDHQSEKLLQKAREEKVFLGDWYRHVIAPVGVNYAAIKYVIGSCPVAEEVACRTVNLPTSINLTEKEQHDIMNLVKKKTSAM